MRLRVDVQRVCDDPGVPEASSISRWAAAAGAPAPPSDGDAELSVRVVDSREGAELNEGFRGKSGATNVLAFPFEAGERTQPPLLGDVVICAPVVASEAKAQGKSIDAHYAHMVVHGVLHLLGHQHDRAEDATRMEALERRVLETLGFPDPYVEREKAP